jgi:RimJ/RimL family protein N-acetyltransferase
VDPGACPQVIDAAFTVLREMVLRSDDDDAPRRLARLGAAYRTVGDPARRAAHDLLRGVSLRRLDDELLDELLTLAVSNAAPEEVMPALDGPPGWTLPRREAFLAFHRARAVDREGERVLVVMVEGRPVGAGRLTPLEDEGAWAIAVWLGRSARGRGIEDAALAGLARAAREAGATTVVGPPGHATS